MAQHPDTVVVASGTSALDNEVGARIDAHRRVFRFKGYEESDETETAPYVGQRITHLCFNTNIDTVRDLRKKLARGVFDDVGRFYLTYTNRRAMRRGMKILKPHIGDVEICAYASVRRYVRRYAYDNDVDFNADKSLSSGMILLAYLTLVGNGGPVAVHGFDALEMDQVEPKHYWSDEDININRLHDLESEGRVIRQMQRDGHVVDIRDTA